MKIIEDWIDKKLTSLVCAVDGFIILTNDDLAELAELLGMKPHTVNDFRNMALRDHIYYLVDQHRDYFQEKLDDFAHEYVKQERETNRVESELCQ
jgi:hypothetical protein